MSSSPDQLPLRKSLPIGESGHTLEIFEIGGAQPGPVLGLIGAVHGDEYEGPLTLSDLVASIDPARLSGRLLVAPVANPDAVAAYTRSSPSDGKNLARCFPGDAEGTYTDRLAALIAEHLIARSDYLIDLHSGGNALDSVFFAGYADEPNGIGAKARGVAEAFGTPFVWRHEPPQPPGRTMSEASDRGIPGVYVEAGGGTFPSEQILAGYRWGVRRVLHHLDMYDNGGTENLTAPLAVVGSGDLDISGPAPATGLCKPHIEVGQQVEPDTLCFTISGLDGALISEVRAGAPGLVMFRRRNRWVETGETLFALAKPDAAWPKRISR